MVVESLESSCEVSKRKHGDSGDGIILLDEFSNGDVNSVSSVSSKRAKVSREMTFQEDSDWEPMQQTKPVESVKWFCVNCTMPNPAQGVILSHGCFASLFCKDNGLTQVEEKRGGSSPSTSSTAVGFDERMLLHSEFEVKELPHVERPDRLRAIAASLATAGVFPGRSFPIHAREITKQELQMVHTSEHVDAVGTTSQLQHSYFTSDTYANEYSARAARLAAGLCADLAKEIFSGRVKNGFALVRPPGHHAGIKDAMGFCLHNNAAVAALVAQAAGARKVLIVDWDVHHGNGTQEIFEKNKSVMYISLHRHEGGKFYPGTGAANEVGTYGAEGYCVNVPWSCSGVGDRDYIYAFQHVVLPIASAFSPDFVIVSAGFDAAKGDPLGCCKVTPAGYSRMTQMLGDLCGGKMLVILEGGYNLRSMSSSATAVIKVLMGENAENDLPIATAPPSRACLRTVLDVMNIQMKFWPSLATSYSKLLSEWEASRLEKRAEPRREAVVTQGAVDAEAVVVDEAAPSEFAFNFSYSGDGSLLDDKEACGELFRLFRLEPDPSRDLSPPDETNLYNEYALSVARSIASVNAMVAEYENALRTARADLEEQKKELEEMALLRRELEEERAKVRAMRLEKKRMKEAKVLKSEVKRLRKSRTDCVAREKMYNELVAKSASCFEKMRKSIVLELNQVSGILSADRETLADSNDDDDEHEI
uniref:histone deacetylase n=1 Tax=Brassica oleracea var. oleracea TaxID=109376 RepID=A0A0D3BBZ5_BRAOL